MASSQDVIEAIQRGDLAEVTRALDSDPSLVNARTHLGVSAPAFAMYCGHPSIADVFVQRGAPIDFWTACSIGDEAEVERLLAADPGLINRHSPDGFVPVALAIFFGHDRLAERLMDAGADPDLLGIDSMKLAPIHAAIARSRPQLARLLLDRGADPNVPQPTGYSPLHAAAASGQKEIAGMLLDHGADASARMNGKTPEELAVERGQAEVAEYLKSRSGAA